MVTEQLEQDRPYYSGQKLDNMQFSLMSQGQMKAQLPVSEREICRKNMTIFCSRQYDNLVTRICKMIYFAS